MITISEKDIQVPSILNKEAPKKKESEEVEKEIGIVEQMPSPQTSSPPPVMEQENEKQDIDNLQSDTQHRYQQIFKTLVEKIYDRDYDLGECLKHNIHFKNFENGTLTWESWAQGDEKKMLITHWSVIKMFVQDLFGIETKIVNIPREDASAAKELKKKVDNQNDSSLENLEKSESPENCNTDSGSMIESIEMKSSCMMPEAGETEAAKEKEPSSILEEPMIKEVLNLFDPKKVRIKKKV